MRNTRYNGSAAGIRNFPPMAEHFLEMEELGLSEADLRQIDSFADLDSARRKAVLKQTKQMLHGEMQALSLHK